MQSDARELRGLQAMGRLTRGALHEIANPLVALVGSAELALEDTEPGTKLHQRISLTHRTGSEIADIVRALQGFVRLQSRPPERLSLGQAAADAVALVTLVLPTHDVTLSTTGDATVHAAPGDVGCALVELLADEVDGAGAGTSIVLSVRTDDGDGVVTTAAGGELRFPGD